LTSFNLPSKIPMLIKPKKYIWNKDPKKEQLGGFLLNDEKYYENLIIKKHDLE
jgi:hypothetical protein